jgi:hypothetical protein
MLSVNTQGNGNKTTAALAKAKSSAIFSDLKAEGAAGVQALSAATPTESGQTARSWDYEIEKRKGGAQIRWFNTHENKGANIALLLQYGHATGTGGYVQGRDYINPAMKSVFDKASSSVWRRVIG